MSSAARQEQNAGVKAAGPFADVSKKTTSGAVGEPPGSPAVRSEAACEAAGPGCAPDSGRQRAAAARAARPAPCELAGPGSARHPGPEGPSPHPSVRTAARSVWYPGTPVDVN